MHGFNYLFWFQVTKGLFLIFYTGFLFGQNPFLWRLTEENGLPSMTIYDLLISWDRFIYLATDAGVYRFDGFNFRPIPALQSRSRGLTSGKYSKDGQLYYRNFSGQLFFLYNDTLRELEGWANHRAEAKDINSYGFDAENKLWINTYIGHVYVSDIKKDHFERFKVIKENDTIDNFFSIAVLRDTIMMTSFEPVPYIFICDTKNKRIVVQKQDFARKLLQIGITGNSFYARMTQDNSDIYIWDGKKFNYHYVLSKVLYGRRIINQADGINIAEQNHPLPYFWFMTNKGAGKITNQGLSTWLLETEAVTGIAKDYEGNYWVSTNLDGLYMIPSLDISILNKKNSFLKDQRITRIIEGPNKTIIIGCFDGNIYQIDRAGNLILQYQKPMQAGEVEFLAWDTARNRLFSSHAIYEFEKKECVFTGFYIKDACFMPDGSFQSSGSNFTAFLQPEPRKGRIFESLSDSFRNKFIYYQKINLQNSKSMHWLRLREVRSRATLFDIADSTYWFGDSDGLWVYDKSGNSHKIIDNSGRDLYAVSLVQMPDKHIVVSTLTQGLFLIKDKKIIRHITTENGLLTNMGGKVRIFDSGGKSYIWLCTPKGLHQIDPYSSVINYANKSDGIGTDLVLDVLVSGDTIWAATNIGVVRMPLDLLKPNSIPPDIFLSGFKIKEKDTTLQTSYILPYNQNSLYISFQALSFKSRGDFRYKYRMVGLDTAWITTTSANNFARYPTLPSGKYLFQVFAINEDDIQSQNPLAISVVILPPYWQKWWFLVLIVLLIILAMSLVFVAILRNIQSRSRLLLAKAQLESELRSSQMASLKAQMNPHFIFNALNSIQEFILLNDKKMANFYLGKFADLMRLILQMSNSQLVTLEEEIKSLELYLQLEALRFEENFSYSIVRNENLDIFETQLPPMLIQPYVENAIKHGLLHKKGEKTLAIQFEVAFESGKKYLICTVQDNGIGREKSAELQRSRKKMYQSFASGATSRRLDLLNSGHNQVVSAIIEDLISENGHPAGTKVMLKIAV